jgi:hypothetical protein
VGIHAAATRGLIARALLLVAVLASACARPAPLPSLDPNADVSVRYEVAGGGQVTFTVKPRYAARSPVAIGLDITAGTVAIRGPLSGRVLVSGLEGEKVIRSFSAAELGGGEVAPGTSRRLQVVWDATDTDGEAAPAETYGLTLDFIVGDGARRLGTVFDVRAP